MKSRHVFAFVAFAIVSAEVPANADDDRARCVASYETGQQERQRGHILAAREALETCSREVCPELVRKDCVVWLRELDATIPSLVVTARSPEGDLATVTLSVDGRPVAERLDGRPIPLDPGEHRLRIVHPDGRSAEETVVVALGEKNRLVRLALPAAPKAESAAAPAPPSGRSLAPFVLSGVALALFGGGITLDVVGSGDLRDLRGSCAPYCKESDLDAARTKIIAGDVLLAAGVVTGAIAAFLFLRDGNARSATARTGGLTW